jgi:SAM-dependent methyltransferase
VTKPACLICESEDTQFHYAKQGFELYKCPNCQHLQIFPVPSIEVLTQVYQDGFGASDRSVNDAEMDRLTQEATREFPVQMLQKFGVSKESFILDMGCSFGYDLFALKKMGYTNAVGMEISEKAVALANTVLRVRAFSSMEALKSSGLRFDFVYLKHNLEHHTDPVRTLELVADLMNPNARLLIGVPNRRSVNGLWGKRWEWVTPPVHIHFFSQKSLEVTLNRVGFRPTQFYSQRGHGLPFVKHALFFSPLVSRIVRWILGGPYDAQGARLPALRRAMDQVFQLISALFAPLSSRIKAKFLIGEELWVLASPGTKRAR